jgi:hypothetical protein
MSGFNKILTIESIHYPALTFLSIKNPYPSRNGNGFLLHGFQSHKLVRYSPLHIQELILRTGIIFHRRAGRMPALPALSSPSRRVGRFKDEPKKLAPQVDNTKRDKSG